jgi:hypothetical protein
MASPVVAPTVPSIEEREQFYQRNTGANILLRSYAALEKRKRQAMNFVSTADKKYKESLKKVKDGKPGKGIKKCATYEIQKALVDYYRDCQADLIKRMAPFKIVPPWDIKYDLETLRIKNSVRVAKRKAKLEEKEVEKECSDDMEEEEEVHEELKKPMKKKARNSEQSAKSQERSGEEREGL